MPLKQFPFEVKPLEWTTTNYWSCKCSCCILVVVMGRGRDARMLLLSPEVGVAEKENNAQLLQLLSVHVGSGSGARNARHCCCCCCNWRWWWKREWHYIFNRCSRDVQRGTSFFTTGTSDNNKTTRVKTSAASVVTVRLRGSRSKGNRPNGNRSVGFCFCRIRRLTSRNLALVRRVPQIFALTAACNLQICQTGVIK